MKLANYSPLYSFSSSGGSGASKSALNFLHLCSVCNTLPFPRKNLVSTSFWFLPLKILTLSPLIRHDSLVSLYTLLTSYPFHYVNLCSFFTSASATCTADSFCYHTQAGLVSEAHLSFLFLFSCIFGVGVSLTIIGGV